MIDFFGKIVYNEEVRIKKMNFKRHENVKMESWRLKL